jgi:ATP-binding cassette, subfamily B, multidrug efflux pump
MRPGPRMMKKDKMNAAQLKKSLGQIALSMKRYFPALILCAVLILGYVVISVISPNVLSDLTNVITQGSTNKNIDMDKIAHYGIVLAILYVSSALLNFLSGFVMTIVAQRYSQSLRKQITEKINDVPLQYFDSRTTGDILSILTNDVDMISQSFQQSLSMFVSAIFMLIGAIIAMFVTSWQLALVCIATVPVMLVIMMVILKLAGPQFIARQDKLGELDGIVEENYNGQMIIKLFNAEDKTMEHFDEKNTQLGSTMFKAEFFGGMLQPMMSFMSYFGYAAVCVAGGLLINSPDSLITMGTVTAFLMYVNLFQSPLTQIAQAMNSLQSAAASGSRVFRFLGEEELSDESQKKNYFLKDGKEQVKGEVEFCNVSFGYEKDREIIHNFSATIHPGMKVAIVGPTGAGKTTMVNLLMRFYETNSGDIRIDGVSIKDMTREELHSLFAMVLQDTWVFDGTLRENLVYNTPGVTEEDLKNVIHDAHLTHFVRALPGGLDYVIKDGSSISGGQKQLITIARAMLKNALMLILDEATSNVDTRTEEKIQEAMDRLSKGKTSFVIAHRLSTIRNSDLILVMKDGNIIEQGNHDSLMQMNGFYASLYNSQFNLDSDGPTID